MKKLTVCFLWKTVTHVASHLKSADSSKVSLESNPPGAQDAAESLSLSESQSVSRSMSSATDDGEKPPSRVTSSSDHRTSMSNALRGSLSRSSSRGSSPNRPPGHPHRSFSGTQAGHISLEAAVGAGKSVKQIVGVGLKSPMDFTLSLARGFHNAPKLYGDESVRQADKVTDLQSGLKAAGKVRLLKYFPYQMADPRRSLDMGFLTVSLAW